MSPRHFYYFALLLQCVWNLETLIFIYGVVHTDATEGAAALRVRGHRGENAVRGTCGHTTGETRSHI